MDEFKFSQEPNFFKNHKSTKTSDASASAENQNIQPDILKTSENLLTENLIKEQYKYQSETKTIISSNRSIAESLNNFDDSYRSGANLKLKDEILNNDSVMTINDQNKNANEASNNRKRRIAHHVKRNEISNNVIVKKLFKKKDEDDEEERGRCSRCQIL